MVAKGQRPAAMLRTVRLSRWNSNPVPVRAKPNLAVRSLFVHRYEKKAAVASTYAINAMVKKLLSKDCK